MFPLGVTGGSQEMTKVVSSVDSTSTLVTALDTVTKNINSYRIIITYKYQWW